MTNSRAAALGLWFALVFPSSFVVNKYLGWEATIAYAIVVAAAVAFTPRLFDRLSSRSQLWLALVTILAVIATFLLIYPVVNTHTPRAGSDDDDALSLGTRAFLAGYFPYYGRTYLGNAIHHLPGAFVLAAPFVLLLGTSAAQNLFWMPAFFVVVNKERDGSTALHLAWIVLLLSPSVMYEVVTGTGYVSNAISVVLGLWWFVRAKHRGLAAIAWGVTLASRANFIFLVPLAVGYLRQHAGWKAALRAAALTCSTIGCLTLPYYLFDRANFGPLEGADRLLVFEGLLPHLGVALMIVMAAFAVVFARTSMSASALFRNAAVIQAFPVVAGVLLASVRDGPVNLVYARYGAFFAWFALMALVLSRPPRVQ